MLGIDVNGNTNNVDIVQNDTSICLGASITLEATSNIPKGLKEKLISHDSPPVYVSLGSKGRYYAAFLDGKKVWDGPDSMDFFLHS